MDNLLVPFVLLVLIIAVSYMAKNFKNWMIIALGLLITVTIIFISSKIGLM